MNDRLMLSSEAIGDFIKRQWKTHLENLGKYFGPFTVRIPSEGSNTWSGYSGQFFEYFSQRSSRESLDANDLAALACLSVKVGHRLAGSIAALEPRLAEMFTALGGMNHETTIWEVDESDLMMGSPLHEIWDLLVSIRGVNSTIASKLLASKFPHLVPISDKRVRKMLKAPEGYWIGWHRAMTSENQLMLASLRREAGLAETVSLLRVADVCIWMPANS